MSFLKSLKINGYRGFIDQFEINFGIPNGNAGSGLTILVGPNGTGKSSIVEALSWCALIEDKPQSDVLNRVLEGELILQRDDGKKIVLTSLSGGGLTVNKEFGFDRDDYAYISTEAIRLNVAGDVDENKSEPYQEYPDIGRMSALSPNLKAKRMRFFLENEEKKPRLQTDIGSYFPDFGGFSMESSLGMNFLKYKNPRSNYADATELGSGFAAVSYLSSYFAIWKEHPASVVIFEEPELYLHPQFQRKLCGQIRELSKNSQVILVTHSPYFINWSDIEAGATLLRSNKSKEGFSAINQLAPASRYLSLLRSGESDWQKPHVFDTASKEILFAEKVLLVEGQEDAGLLKRFAIENSIELNFEIFGYGVGGSGNMTAFLQMAQDLGVQAAALFDSNSENEIAQSKRLFQNSLVEVLPTPDIRDKPEKGLTGVFDKGGRIKAEWKHDLIILFRRFESYFK